MTSGQTRAIKSRFLTTSFGTDTSAIKVSRVLAPNGTATPSRERSLSSGTKLNGPKDMTNLVGAGSIMSSLTAAKSQLRSECWPGKGTHGFGGLPKDRAEHR